MLEPKPVTKLSSTIALLLISIPCIAADGFVSTAGERYNPFSSAMDMMIDAMDSYARKRTWNDALAGYGSSMQPWAWGAIPGMTPQIPGQSQMQQMMQSAPAAASAAGNMANQMGAAQQSGAGATGAPGVTSPFPGGSTAAPMGPARGMGGTIDGVWQGSSGEIFVVRNGYCRIYASREAYNDCRIAVQGSTVRLASPTSGQSLQYEYAVYEGRMALRGADGNLLLYRRLPDTALRDLLY